jgi:hypothetical protein
MDVEQSVECELSDEATLHNNVVQSLLLKQHSDNLKISITFKLRKLQLYNPET